MKESDDRRSRRGRRSGRSGRREPTYTRCPRFGTGECCGTHHQASVNRINGVEIELDYKDGSTVYVHPWIVTQPDETDTQWTSLRMQNLVFENIDTTQLTLGSRMRYAKYHHWGKLITHKRRDCPFKK